MSYLIKNGYVVTMNSGREIHDGGFVAVGPDGRIEAVGAGAPPAGNYEAVLDAGGMLVLPGLVNLHQHHWYNLFKGLGGGLLLEEWVRDLLLPTAARLTADDLRAAAYLSAMEMIRTGTTCCLNHSVTTTGDDDVAATIEPMAEVGVRQVFAKDFRCRTAANPEHPHSADEEADHVSGLVDRWDGAHDGLVRMALAIESNAHWVAAGMSTEELIETGYRLARDRGLRITNHTAGGTFSLETGYLHAMRETGRTDVLYLMQLGVLDELWLLIHGIHLTDTDVGLMAESGCNAVYTPTSEAIRGGGIGRWAELARRGINCALGTDGPMVDGSVDMVEQIKACTVIQNTANLDPTVMPVERSLEMATVNAARALGMTGEIGSLEPGKQADVAVFDNRGPYIQVAHKPISNFVCSGRGADAHTVLVGGRPVLEAGRLATGPDPGEVVREATARGQSLAASAGVLERARSPWPVRTAGGSAR